MNEARAFWEGEGGDSYMRRNDPTPAEIAARTKALGRVLTDLPIVTALEVGCGPGATSAALLGALPGLRLWAVDPNESARKATEALCGASVHVTDGHAEAIPAADASFDLVVTAGVLIHVPPVRLADAMAEIVRVSRRYVLAIEYFAPQSEPIMYHGDYRIWRNDFGRLYVEKHGLRPVSWGFFWKGAGGAGDGFDDTVYSLLERA